jgi:hypothetical protein
MKTTTVCTTWCRCRFVSKSGRIRSIAAPVVPIRLADTAPMPMKAALTVGVASRSPWIRTPPVIV